MRIERVVSHITTLGPGNRLCIWVNGCSRGCAGCVSERLQAADDTTEVDIAEFLDEFGVEGADGITVSGGEPFEQTEQLALLVKYLKGRGAEDILVYTGYTVEELRARHDADTDYILSEISVLIDGPYIQAHNTGKNNLKGSDNQRIIFINKKYETLYNAYIHDERAMQEMTLGNIRLAAGIPNDEFIENFKKS